ncbi:MAG: histidine kinase [Clostridia bacterium]|nr:histidine kinase [Clostridia bacterium]
MDISEVLKTYPAFFQLLMPMTAQLIGLTIAVCIDAYLNSRQKKVMLIVIATVLLLAIQNYVEYHLVVGVPHMRARTMVAIFGYCIRPLILALFLWIVQPTRRRVHTWVLIGCNTAVHLTALFSHLCFWIDETNHYNGGPLKNTCLVVSLLLLAELLYVTVCQSRNHRKREMLLPLFVVILILIGCGMDLISDKVYQPEEYLTVAVVISCVGYYSWLHLQLVWQHEESLRAEQRIQIMMSQIQPHFLNNTLSTIQALCRIDPEKAFETTAKFGTYLQHNLDSLTQPNLIPIEKELEHTRIYAEIEMIRFPHITVSYDIMDSSFLLPALSIQPLVENSIRHGVRIRKQGQVTIRTRKVDGYHEIQILDNGKGFDPDSIAGAGTHIGLSNVKERVEQMCGGTLQVMSRIGEGTTVTIRIPEKEGSMP